MWGAFHLNAAAHGFDQFLGNQQSQSGTAIFATDGFVCLTKGLEQSPYGRLIHADTGIANTEKYALFLFGDA